ncbi:MAG: hypothetical protein WC516_08115 [Patescibacteria group bacterium]|jgi:hypothetical protein
MTEYQKLIKQYPMIVNHYKAKIENARKIKQQNASWDELTRKELEPILQNALNMVKSNIPPTLDRPDTVEELALELKRTKLDREFGLREGELDEFIVDVKRKPVQAPMPNKAMQNLKKLIRRDKPQTGEMR